MTRLSMSRTASSRRLFALLAFAAAIFAISPASAQQPNARLKVVTTFSILADFARNVGGDRVDVTSLVGPNGDVHVYAPTAADVQAVKRAKLVIINGLGLEGWLPRLIDSSATSAISVVATKGIVPRQVGAGERLARHREVGSSDPHAWQSVENAKVYVANIRDATIEADPANAATYKDNATAYLAKLDSLDREVRDAVARIPADRRKVISAHDAFGYFAAAYGIAFVAPQGVSTESEPSARDVAAVITQIRQQKIPAIFLENINDPRLIRQIASETGATVGGTLFSDSLTDAEGAAPSYVEMMRHNIKTIATALAE
jgi:zinc/manganese transport system substrate-binding protein